MYILPFISAIPWQAPETGNVPAVPADFAIALLLAGFPDDTAPAKTGQAAPIVPILPNDPNARDADTEEEIAHDQDRCRAALEFCRVMEPSPDSVSLPAARAELNATNNISPSNTISPQDALREAIPEHTHQTGMQNSGSRVQTLDLQSPHPRQTPQPADFSTAPKLDNPGTPATLAPVAPAAPSEVSRPIPAVAMTAPESTPLTTIQTPESMPASIGTAQDQVTARDPAPPVCPEDPALRAMTATPARPDTFRVMPTAVSEPEVVPPEAAKTREAMPVRITALPERPAPDTHPLPRPEPSPATPAAPDQVTAREDAPPVYPADPPLRTMAPLPVRPEAFRAMPPAGLEPLVAEEPLPTAAERLPFGPVLPGMARTITAPDTAKVPLELAPQITGIAPEPDAIAHIPAAEILQRPDTDSPEHAAMTVLREYFAVPMPAGEAAIIGKQPTGAPTTTPAEPGIVGFQASPAEAGPVGFLKATPSRARLLVHPKELGEIRIQIEVHDRMATIRFETERTEVRQFLENLVPGLRHAFEASSLSLGEVSVQGHLPGNRDEQPPPTRFMSRDDPTLEQTRHPEPSRLLHTDTREHALLDTWA